jgi:hypothetical protein
MNSLIRKNKGNQTQLKKDKTIDRFPCKKIKLLKKEEKKKEKLL